MTRLQKTLLVSSIAVLSTMFIFSCNTVEFQVEENMPPAEYFQRAQEAVDLNQWNVAIAYYEAFLNEYPEDTANVYAAEYEIGYVYYKMNDYETAEERFRALLAKYEGEVPQEVPLWPKILAAKLLEKIQAVQE